ncbi:DUF2652 domain-containing protein [Winogradskyella immobilis]|uniref:DUF2652 domain-containing protein n=1 Tax=Winogradskyella immobilis TaxID=2816852 RepID=A0ABS8EQB1_9FLAO|nr:DUF2652 domain-containing protein [Winogradskyella immobilis]MCC1485418.1 DUF2652 domain-containing protein [Winogradskyella immobilis]MCG0017510.1 DUF2652 domain-containing protein [Winogradskyella immobilis]
MKKSALYFMPDISGFTNFVQSTDIEHSKHIVSELLEKLIDSDIIGLQIAEIEGDALFMYTLNIPSFSTIIAQSQKMLEAFTYEIEKYETQRICQCGACMSASNLKLKFVVHYGEIAFMRVKHIVKPYGTDVIKTHRLLKNSIPSNQYLLISSELAEFYKINFDEELAFEESKEEYDLGLAKYFYKNFIKPKIETPKLANQLTQKPKTPPNLEYSTILNAKIVNAFNIITDFSMRALWYKLVDKLLYDELRINRIGMRHNCISGSSIYKVDTLGSKEDNGQLVYGEKTEDIEYLKTYSYYMSLNSISPNEIHLQAEVFFDFSTEEIRIQNQVQNMIKNAWQDSFERLSKLISHMRIEAIENEFKIN